MNLNQPSSLRTNRSGIKTGISTINILICTMLVMLNNKRTTNIILQIFVARINLSVVFILMIV